VRGWAARQQFTQMHADYVAQSTRVQDWLQAEMDTETATQSFLSEVPILQGLTGEERELLSSSLEVRCACECPT
jgi:hypothetical protein